MLGGKVIFCGYGMFCVVHLVEVWQDLLQVIGGWFV